MSTKYPEQIDTDAQLPAIYDGVSEMGVGSLNAMRNAIFAIQKTLGENPQGATADLVSRISESLNDDGTLKASAILAAGLIALPITNAQISNSAGIEESKLDLDFATQTLQNQITSNDVDIANLQRSIAAIINNFAQHVNGTAFQHDSYDILLDKTSPGSTPSEFVGLTAVDVGAALIEINELLREHINISTDDAHQAVNIGIDGTEFVSIAPTIDNVQDAINALDLSRKVEMIEHRDHLHANGFDAWANDQNGYSVARPLFPLGTDSFEASVSLSHKTKIKFTDTNLSSFRVNQGDVVVILDGYAEGTYLIDDVGPRTATSKPLLTFDEVEVTRPIDGITSIIDGYVTAKIYSASSVSNLRGNVAATIYQSGSLDTIQFARPNSAKVVSLGIVPELLTGSETLVVEAGVDAGSRSVSIGSLDEGRSGALPAGTPISVDTIVERVNAVFKTNNFPVAAYRIGDEFALSHNWDGYAGYYLKVSSTGTANTILGFDGYGADILDQEVLPTQTAKFYVGGNDFSEFTTILDASGTASGTTISFSGTNPISLGVRIGHLAQIKNHSSNVENGTYIITALTNNSITVHNSIAVGAVDVEITHDSVPLHEFSNNGQQQVIETFLDSFGRAGYNLRASCDNISGLKLVDVSDNTIAGEYKLFSTATSGGRNVHINQENVSGQDVFVPTGFVGKKSIYFPSNIESITIELTGSLGSSPFGGADLVINQHINEEDVLEVCSVRSNGTTLLSNIIDRRLFGSIGLDEIREDVIQSYIESPQSELRSNGITRGFDIISLNEVDVVFPNNSIAVVRGGVAYVGGVRVDVPTKAVVFPIPDDPTTFYICLNANGNYTVVDLADFTLEDILEGNAGQVLVIASVDHAGTTGQDALDNDVDLRYFINELDAKVDLIVDTTNHMVGNFASFEAALAFANNYPSAEKFKIRIVSKEDTDIIIPADSVEITLEIDGQVGDVTIGENAKIISSSLSSRDTPHITGTLTIQAGVKYFEAANLTIAGSVEINSTETDGRAVFSTCVFNETVTINSDTDYNLFANCTFAEESSGIIDTGTSALQIHGCLFKTGVVTCTKASASTQVAIKNTVFSDAFGEAGTFIGGIVQISDSHFSGTSGSLIIENGIIDTCTFVGNGLSNKPLINVQASDAQNQGVLVTSCVFSGISLSGTSMFVSMVSGTTPGRVRVESSIFEDCTFNTNNPSVKCNDFVGNTLKGSNGVGNCLVVCSNFIENSGFHVYDGIDQRMPPRIIANNIFAANTFGHCCRVDYVNDTVTDGATFIYGNKFHIGSDQKGILLAAENAGAFLANWSPRIQIHDNYFSPDGYTVSDAFGIDFATTSSDMFGGINDRAITVQSNVFRDIAAFRSSDNLLGLQINDNHFDNASFTLGIEAACTFDGNRLVRDTEATFTGPASVSGIIIANNNSNTEDNCIIEIACGTLSNSSILNNVVDFTFACSMSDCAVSNNFGLVLIDSAGTFNNVLMNDNNLVLGSDFALIEWVNSSISDNIISSGAEVEFSFDTSDDVKTSVTGNIFDCPVFLDGDSAIRKLMFADNFCIDSTQSLTCVQSLDESFISRNFDFSIILTGGTNGSSITSNLAADGYITINNTCASTDLSGNTIAIVNTPASSVANLTIQGNTVYNSINLVTANVTASKQLQSVIISNNNLIGATLNVLGSKTVSATGNLEISGLSVSGNKISGNLVFMDTATVHASSTINIHDNVFINNTIDGIIYMRTATSTPDSILNTVFDSNVADSAEFTHFGFDGLTIVGNSFENPLVMDFDNTSVLDSGVLIIESNTLTSGMTMDVNCDSIVNIEVNNNVLFETDIEFNIDADLMGMSMTTNRFRAFKFLGTATPSSSVSFSNMLISNNIINGQAGVGTDYPGFQFANTGGDGDSNTNFVSLYFVNNFATDYSDRAAIHFADGGSGSFTLQNCSINGNYRFNLETNVASDMEFEKCNISNNVSFMIYGDGSVATAFEECTISNNIFGTDGSRGSIEDAAVGGGSMVFANCSMIGNVWPSGGGMIAMKMRPAATGASFSGVQFSGNFIAGSACELGDIEDSVFSQNISGGTDLNIGTASNCTFSENVGLDLNFDSIDSGIFSHNQDVDVVVDTSTTGVWTGNIGSTLTGGTVFEGSYTGNRNGTVTISEGFTGTFNDNTFCNLNALSLEGSFSNNYFSDLTIPNSASAFMIGAVNGNVSFTTLSIQGQSQISGSISHNKGGSITLNSTGFTATGDKQLKVIGNTLSGTLNTIAAFTTNAGGGDNKTFFWGNTASSTGSPQHLTLAGTVAINITTANKIGGTIAN